MVRSKPIIALGLVAFLGLTALGAGQLSKKKSLTFAKPTATLARGNKQDYPSPRDGPDATTALPAPANWPSGERYLARDSAPTGAVTRMFGSAHRLPKPESSTSETVWIPGI